MDSTGADGAGAVKRAGAPDLRLLLAAVAADADAAAATARTDIIVIDGVALAAVEQPPTAVGFRIRTPRTRMQTQKNPVTNVKEGKKKGVRKCTKNVALFQIVYNVF